MAKNTIIVYTDLMEQLEELSLEERGTILTAMIKYQMGEELPKMSKLLKLVFIPIRQSIDRDNAAYLVKCEINRRNGKLGGRPKNQTDTEETERLFEKPKKPDNDNDTDIDNENDNDIDKDNDNDNESGVVGVKTAPTPTPLSESELDSIINAWNSRMCTKNISKITKERQEKIMKCGSYDLFYSTIYILDAQDYLKDQANKGKPVMFDWFIQPDNFQKVTEGNYAHTYGGGGSYGLARDW